MNDAAAWPIYLMILAPGFMAVAAVVGAVLLLRPPKDGKKREVTQIAAAVVLLVFALGVGVCYGGMLKL